MKCLVNHRNTKKMLSDINANARGKMNILLKEKKRYTLPQACFNTRI